jgi:hypothetical protein
MSPFPLRASEIARRRAEKERANTPFVRESTTTPAAWSAMREERT